MATKIKIIPIQSNNLTSLKALYTYIDSKITDLYGEQLRIGFNKICDIHHEHIVNGNNNIPDEIYNAILMYNEEIVKLTSISSDKTEMLLKRINDGNMNYVEDSKLPNYFNCSFE